MKHSFFVNFLGLLFIVLGFTALGSVDLAVSASLVNIFVASFLFITAGALLSVGLSPAKKRRVRHSVPRAAAQPQNAVVFRRAA